MVLTQPLLDLGVLGNELQRRAEQPDGGLLPLELAATSTTSIASGIDPSGKVAVANPVSTSACGARRRSST